MSGTRIIPSPLAPAHDIPSHETTAITGAPTRITTAVTVACRASCAGADAGAREDGREDSGVWGTVDASPIPAHTTVRETIDGALVTTDADRGPLATREDMHTYMRCLDLIQSTGESFAEAVDLVDSCFFV